MNRSFWGRRGLLGLGSASVALGLGTGGLEPVTGTGSATVSSPVTTGTIGQAFAGGASMPLAGPGASGAGTQAFGGSSSTALVGPGASGSGAVSVGASGSVPLAAPSAAGAGSLAFGGAASVWLEGPGASGAGAQAFALVGLAELGPTTGVGLGVLAFDATGSAVLLPVEASGRMRLVILGRRWAEPARWLLDAAPTVPPRAARLLEHHALAVVAVPPRSAESTVPTREATMPAQYRVGDTLPAFTATLRLNGSPRALAPDETALLVYRRKAGGEEVERSMSIVDRAAGRVSYSWQAGELVEGTYVTTVIVDDGVGGIESFPAGELVVTRRA